MRQRRYDIEFNEPTGRGRVSVIDDSHRSDSPDVEYCQLVISKTAADKTWQYRTDTIALLTDAQAVLLRAALDEWLSRHDQAPAPISPEPPLR